MRKRISDTEYIARDIVIQHTTDDDGSLIAVFPCEDTRKLTKLIER